MTSHREFANERLLQIVTAISVGGIISLLALEIARRGYLRSDKFAGVPPEELPTCVAFLFDPDALPMVFACLAAGSISALVCFVTSFNVRRKTIAMFLMVNAITAVFALVTALAMSALHIPSGH